MKACNNNIEKALLLAEEMLLLADQGDADREDVMCGVLYGILRDTGYKLKQLAQKEKAAHVAKGIWPE